MTCTCNASQVIEGLRAWLKGWTDNVNFKASEIRNKLAELEAQQEDQWIGTTNAGDLTHSSTDSVVALDGGLTPSHTGSLEARAERVAEARRVLEFFYDNGAEAHSIAEHAEAYVAAMEAEEPPSR